MSANWQAIENKLVAVVTAAMGQAVAQVWTGRVYWDHQNMPRLNSAQGPFATLHHDFGQSAGGVDETEITDNPASILGDGEELLIESKAHLDFTLRVQVFGGAFGGNASPVGPYSAGSILSKLPRYLGLETVIDDLEVEGIAIVECGPVQNLTGLLETDFESRAAIDVRLRVADGISTTETFIETVEATTDLNP